MTSFQVIARSFYTVLGAFCGISDPRRLISGSSRRIAERSRTISEESRINSVAPRGMFMEPRINFIAFSLMFYSSWLTSDESRIHNMESRGRKPSRRLHAISTRNAVDPAFSCDGTPWIHPNRLCRNDTLPRGQ